MHGIMTLFLTLFSKLIPLLAIILLGWVAGCRLHVKKESVATLLLYILAPVIVFHGAYTAELNAGIAILPAFFFLSACLFGFTGLFIGRFLWKDNTRNIFAYTVGTGNTGYFGIPVALALLGDASLSAVVLSTMGLIFYENSVGFFLTARGHYSVRDSIWKVARLPSLYALLLGLAINALHITLPEGYPAIAQNFRGAYTVLGTMMVGLGMSGQALAIDWKFLSSCFLTKFILWPVYAFGFVLLDGQMLHTLTPMMHTVVLLLSIMPMAANTVVVATALNVQPGKAAFAVLVSTLFALVYIPLVLALSGMY